MIYNITIPQYAIIQNELHLSIEEAFFICAILQIKDAQYVDKILYQDELYLYIDAVLIKSKIPLFLNILSDFLENLKKKDFIKSHPEHEQYYCFSPKVSLLFSCPSNNFCVKKDKKNSIYIYLMIDQRTKLYKIGRSVNPKYRERTLQSDNPLIDLVFSKKAGQEHETYLHEKFAEKRIRGEWFSLNSEDVNYIKNYLTQLQ